VSYVRRFVMFWYDFLVGEKIELFVGPLLILLIIGVAVKGGLYPALAGILMFLLVVGVAGFSLARSLRATKS